MKTKIIYISGNEVFDMRDIRAAFEEVRCALNLDQDTVLFGVPVDSEDAGFTTKTDSLPQETETNEKIEIIDDIPEQIPESEFIEPEPETISEPIDEVINTESVVEQPVKKRGRPHKEKIVEDENSPEIDNTPVSDEKIVPILSVLSTKEEEIVPENVVDDIAKDEFIPEISDEIVNDTADENIDIQQSDDAADLEKLLSAMTPLDESEEHDAHENYESEQTFKDVSDDDVSVDATLEQLAAEFAENQDKIKSEKKSSSRNRIGNLRSILPFKQSKRKDTGLGDLFGWAGIAANDEDFSVPGFFTNAASRK